VQRQPLLSSGRRVSAPGSKTLTVNNQAGTTQVTAASGTGQIHVVQRPAGKPTAYRKTAGSAATIGASCPGGIHLGDCQWTTRSSCRPAPP